ncbi:hypothetical protein [Mucilaginibacter sp.]|uniref:hypothetical protein n=1 Tax=Mucilaginibacter sp. TaxID=1882438 RepID=UPI0025E5063F|nr:hypothetical protein [Mucilaginibacter sp.]
MKIIPQPLSNEDIVSKSRKVTGINKWARSSRTMGTILLFLGWLTIPFEVLFRRDFGSRWFNGVSYVAGLVNIIGFWLLSDAVWALEQYFYQFQKYINPTKEGDLLTLPTNNVFATILSLYVYMGAYHLFKSSWRSQVGIPGHSFDDGTSRFRWVGNILTWALNMVVTPMLVIFWWLIPRKQRKGKPTANFITDPIAFTDIIVEPALIMALGIWSFGVPCFWLILSAIAVFVHAQRKEMARKTKALDFQDSKVEAEIMRELRNGKKDQVLAKKEPAAIVPQPLMRLVIQYPNINVIIDELHSEKWTSGKN